MFRPAVLPPPPMVWNREKREREKRSISIIRKTRKGSVSSRYNTQDTLISPTGGFYRLQPPSDTRLVVVKISDAPRPGERGRAVNRCRLIEHIHVRGFTPLYTHTYIHIYFFTVILSLSIQFTLIEKTKERKDRNETKLLLFHRRRPT